MTAWNIVLVTTVLAAAVSFFVAFVIHMMCLLIKRFAKPALALPAAAANISQQGGSVPTVEMGQELEIAVAIAAIKAHMEQQA